MKLFLLIRIKFNGLNFYLSRMNPIIKNISLIRNDYVDFIIFRIVDVMIDGYI